MIMDIVKRMVESLNLGATGRSMLLAIGSTICSLHSLSSNTCKCATTSKRPHHKVVNAAKGKNMPAKHKCLESGVHKTWSMGKGAAGPCSMHRSS